MEDTIILGKNGTVTLTLDDRKVILRRPKIGEFNTIRDVFYELGDAAKVQREAGERVDQTDEVLDWYALAIKMLTDGEYSLPVNDVDSLPTWLLDPMLPADLIAHWRTAPLPRSGRSML